MRLSALRSKEDNSSLDFSCTHSSTSGVGFSTPPGDATICAGTDSGESNNMSSLGAYGGGGGKLLRDGDLLTLAGGRGLGVDVTLLDIIVVDGNKSERA